MPPDDRTPDPVPLSRSDRNHYALSGLDRLHLARRDAGWVAATLRGGESRIVPVWRSRNLVNPGEPPEIPPRAVLLEGTAAGGLIAAADETVLLGESGGRIHFAVDLSALDEEALHAAIRTTGAAVGPGGSGGSGGLEFLDLRFVGPHLDRRDGNMLAYARGMMTWHRRHRFCGSCGTATESRDGGHLRVCTNADCAQNHFPRTDPAVIMLVTLGDECLLGRSARFPPGMYSTLAGFVEPGETLEAAVAREVFEEAGIRVTDVRYHSSQPWPFPTSLMLGFHATALDRRLRIDSTEIEDARWVGRDRVRAYDGSDDFRLPRRDSIARRLIEDWAEGRL